MATKQQKVTLCFAWNEYSTLRRLKPNSVRNGHNMLKRCFGDWWARELKTITENMVEKRFLELSEKAPTLGNNACRILRTVYNFAIYRYRGAKNAPRINPVLRLSHLKLWNKNRARLTCIQPHQMRLFLWAVFAHQNETLRDYLLTLLLTGLRHSEAASLQWSNVDLKRGFITALDTKNGKDHCIPMSTMLWDIMRERFQTSNSQYVFEGRRGGGHFTNPYKAIDKMCYQIGIDFRPHDLRRTWVYIAERAGVDFITRKRALNHSFQDVTSVHYSVWDPEELRPAMETVAKKVADYLNAQDAEFEGPLPKQIDSISILEPTPLDPPPKNSKHVVTPAQQILIEARIVLALQRGVCTKKSFYQKIGGQFPVNRIELERILSEMESRDLISKEFNERDMHSGFRYRLRALENAH